MSSAEHPDVRADAVRLLGGARRLLEGCERRITPLVAGRAKVGERPALLLHRALTYGQMGARWLHEGMWMASPAHGMPLVRAFVEQSARFLWATRYGWDRYWSWCSRHHVAHRDKAVRTLEPEAVDLFAIRTEELRPYIDGERPMPDPLVDVVADNERADRLDPHLRALAGGHDPAHDARRVCFVMLNSWLHRGAHGDPGVLLRLDDTDWRIEALCFYVAALWLVEAVHVELQWSQEPVMEAHEWITMGARNHEESAGSYGTLGLPPLE